MKKKLFCLLLTLAIVFALLPPSVAKAAEGQRKISTVEVLNFPVPEAGQYPGDISFDSTVFLHDQAPYSGNTSGGLYFETVSYSSAGLEGGMFAPRKIHTMTLYLRSTTGGSIQWLVNDKVSVKINYPGVTVTSVTRESYMGGWRLIISAQVKTKTVIDPWCDYTEASYIKVNNFTPPIAEGDKPCFTFSSGYPKLYTFSNIKWYPTNNPSSTMNSSSTFKANTAYTCEFTVKANSQDDYVTVFADTNYHMTDINATLETITRKSDQELLVKAGYEATDIPKRLTSISVTGITQPRPGFKPTTSGIKVSAGLNYAAPTWRGTFAADGSFKADNTYYLDFKLGLATGYIYDLKSVNNITANFGTPEFLTFDTSFQQVQFTVKFTCVANPVPENLGKFTIDLASSFPYSLRWDGTDKETAALRASFSAFNAQKISKTLDYQRPWEWYDLNGDGKADFHHWWNESPGAYSSFGIGKSYSEQDTCTVYGTVTLNVDADGRAFLQKYGKTAYYSTVEVIFPKKYPEDLGKYYFDLVNHTALYETDPVLARALMDSLDACGSVATRFPGDPASVDLSGDGLPDITYCMDGSSLVVELSTQCKAAETLVLKLNDECMELLADRNVEKCFKEIGFYFTPRPASSTGLKAVPAGKNKVKLTWNKVEGAEGYLIYAQKNGSYAYAGMTSSPNTTSFTDTKALDTDYNYYWVFPYVKNQVGNMIPGGSDKYKFAKGVCVSVTGLKAGSSAGRVTLTWTKVEGADGYLIYGIHPGESYKYLGMASGTSWYDAKASKTDWNYYWVFPYHQGGGGQKVAGLPPAKYVYGKAR